MIRLLTGENEYAIAAERDAILSAHVQKHGELSICRFDGSVEDHRQVLTALTTLPFLATEALVILNQPSEQKELTDKLQDWLEQKNESTTVLLIEPKLDKRSTWYKYLLAHQLVRPLQHLSENQLLSWVQSEVREAGASIEVSAARLLIRYTGPNQRTLASEILKLTHYTKHISNKEVEELVQPRLEETIFSLLDALFSSHPERAYKIYDQLQVAAVSAHEVISMIGWRVSVLAQVALVPGSVDEIAKSTGLNPYTVKQSVSLAKSLRREDVTWLAQAVVRAELRIKRDGEKPERVVQVLLAEIDSYQKTART